VARQPLGEATLERINAICPGTRVEGPRARRWIARDARCRVGARGTPAIGYAGNAEVRYRGATGGVLTALDSSLLASGRANSSACGCIRKAPMRTERA